MKFPSVSPLYKHQTKDMGEVHELNSTAKGAVIAAWQLQRAADQSVKPWTKNFNIWSSLAI